MIDWGKNNDTLMISPPRQVQVLYFALSSSPKLALFSIPQYSETVWYGSVRERAGKYGPQVRSPAPSHRLKLGTYLLKYSQQASVWNPV